MIELVYRRRQKKFCVFVNQKLFHVHKITLNFKRFWVAWLLSFFLVLKYLSYFGFFNGKTTLNMTRYLYIAKMKFV